MARVYQGQSPIRVVRSVKNEESELGTGKIQLPANHLSWPSGLARSIGEPCSRNTLLKYRYADGADSCLADMIRSGFRTRHHLADPPREIALVFPGAGGQRGPELLGAAWLRDHAIGTEDD